MGRIALADYTMLENRVRQNRPLNSLAAGFQTILNALKPPNNQKFHEVADDVVTNTVAPAYKALGGPDKKSFDLALAAAQINWLQLLLAKTAKVGTNSIHWHRNTIRQTVSGTAFQWDVAFRFEENPTMAAEVYIHLNVQFAKANSWGISQQDFDRQVVQLKGEFATRITEAWGGRFAITGPGFSRVIRVGVALADASTPANEKYVVNVDAPASFADAQAGLSADELRRLTQSLDAARSGGASDLRHDPVLQSARQKAAEFMDSKTLSMSRWSAKDPSGVAHEFGHMIGNADEYECTSYTPNPVGGVTPGQAYDANWATPRPNFNVPIAPPVSIMYDSRVGAAPIVRHMTYIKHAYEIWKGVAKDTYGLASAG